MHINAPNYVIQMHVAYICIHPILLYVKTIYFQNDSLLFIFIQILKYAFYNDRNSIFLCTHMYVRTREEGEK